MPPEAFNESNAGDGPACPTPPPFASSGRTAGPEIADRLAVVAHELRNILSPLQLRAKCARRSRDPAVIRKSLEVIEHQVARMSALVDDLLRPSNVTVATYVLKSERQCLQTLADDAFDSARPLAAAKGQRITFDCARRPIHALVDADRIQQVLANLICNAVKFTPVGGSVEISVDRDGETGIIRVADTGAGMTALTLSRAFDRHWQGPETLDLAAGGLGIGLALAKQLVELQGGTLHAESRGQNQGSLFSIRLPLVAEPGP